MYKQAKTIEKVMWIGSYKVSWRMLPIQIFVKVTFSSDGKLSITGVESPYKNGDCAGSCGQIDSGYDHRDPSQNDARTTNPIKASEIEFAKGWNDDLWYGLLNIWDRWHLNDMKPYCQHQEIMGWHKERIDPSRPSTAYDKFDGIHSSWNLKGWVRAPLGYLAVPCPICGYKYGTAWKSEIVPDSVIEFLCALPDSDCVPAWI